ncbi:MAG: RlmE family RNA methyltransferase [Pseudomonadota bacterium]
MTNNQFRNKATRLKPGARKHSSHQWLTRQLNDPYVIQAKLDGYRSRAAYKMIEINDKFRLFSKGMKVIDLGAAPGGWSQIAAKHVGSSGAVVAIDLLEIEPISGVSMAQMDFYDAETPGKIIEMLGDKADVVMSDMAANTTGHSTTDHLRIIDLCEHSFSFAIDVLKPGGSFVAKILRGGTEHELLAKVKQQFAVVKHFKPQSSRADSKEMYLVATGFKG